MTEPTDEQVGRMAQKLYSTLPSTCTDWMPSNFAAHYATYVLSLLLPLAEALENIETLERAWVKTMGDRGSTSSGVVAEAALARLREVIGESRE